MLWLLLIWQSNTNSQSVWLSDLWPDLVAYSCLAKIAIIVELTVCFETNFKDAQKRKEAKYTELVEEVEKNDFIVDLITLEVGSQCFVNYESLDYPKRIEWVIIVSIKISNPGILSDLDLLQPPKYSVNMHALSLLLI